MNIYKFAMQMEQDGANYYRKLAGKTANTGLRNILTRLVDAEINHYDIIHEMEQNNTAGNMDTDLLDNVKNIFAGMKDTRNHVVDESEADLYREAMEIEKKSVRFYRAKAAETGDPAKKEALLKIADEEKKHYEILEGITDFVARPEQWLEDAEWTHLEDY